MKNNTKKIGLITVVNEDLEKTQMFGVKYLPVWAMTLKSYIDDDSRFSSFIYDTRISPAKDTPFADIFLVSGINQDLEALLKFVELIKRKFINSKVVIGGPITYSLNLINQLDKLQAFDSIYIGDGENSINEYLNDFYEKGRLQKVFHNKKRFELINSKKMDFSYIRDKKHNYYGGVIEVSRGCPFLCEFCDIRTMPNNNRANNKKIDVILDEIDSFCRLGINNILFACDNFIGDFGWAEEVCDAIIEYKEKSGNQPNFYTWLTINLSFKPNLMRKLRLAGFEMFFIGVESFGQGQLQETAKVQNTNLDMKDAISKIQSYGFIVVAGIIFGFDSDSKNVVDQTLNGILECGLISGDPSLLTALPGTPLYKRMSLASRLRDGKVGLGGAKYHTNIKYIFPKDKIINDFIRFVEIFNSPNFQFNRFKIFLSHSRSENFIRFDGEGYLNLESAISVFKANRLAIFLALKRFIILLRNPIRLFYVVKGLREMLRYENVTLSSWFFWIFNWSNSIIKYSSISENDFDIGSIEREVQFEDVLPNGYEFDFDGDIPLNKIKSQRKITSAALRKNFKRIL